MNVRLIDFEGIHGSGKSACAWNLYNNLKNNNIAAMVFYEYDMDSLIENPCDIRMTAVTTAEEFNDIIRIYPLYEKVLREKVKVYKINKVASERVSDNYELYPDWIDWMVEYVKDSQYGRIHNVLNKDDLMVYFNERASLEEVCFEKLNSNKDKVFIDLMSYDEENEYIYTKVIKLT